MNAALDWKAVLAGAGFNVALGLMLSFGSGFLFGMVGPGQFAILAFVLRVFSAFADIGAGALAGYMARRDGPLHGAVASLLGTVVMLPISLLRMWLMTRAGGEVQLGASYWIDFGLWTVVGIVLAGTAGFLAVEWRRTSGR
jgi:hypothetical protein